MKSSLASLGWISAIALFLCGCVSRPIGSTSWMESSGLKSTQSAAALSALANEEGAPEKQRAIAIFRLFANYVHPGQSAVEVHNVLSNSLWLQTVTVCGVSGNGPDAPVEFTDADSRCLIALFPDKRGESDWGIWLVLSGHPPPEDVLKFLEGDRAIQSDARLKEFALSFKGGIPGYSERTERFSPRGTNVYFW